MSDNSSSESLQSGALATALVAFESTDEVELTLQAEEVVLVLETETPDSNGWILVERVVDGKSGFVPSSFLTIYPTTTTDSFNMQRIDGALPASPTAQPVSSSQSDVSRQSTNNPFDRLDDTDYSSDFIINPMGATQPKNSPMGTTQPSNINYPHQQHNGFNSQPAAQRALPPTPDVQPSASTSTTNFPPAWLGRDANFQYLLPRPPVRRWYYRDASNTVKGPHDPQEMFALFSTGAVSTIVGLEVGSGVVSCIEERPLNQVYPNPAMAFRQAPVLPGAWYYLETNTQNSATEEHGPFSAQQMRLWFQQGCFARYSQIRSANGLSPYTMLSSVFPDPTLAFVDSTQVWPEQQQAQQVSQQQQRQPTQTQNNQSVIPGSGYMGDVGMLANPRHSTLADSSLVKSASGKDLLFAALSGTAGSFPGGALHTNDTSTNGNAYAEVDDLLAVFETRPTKPAPTVANSSRRKSRTREGKVPLREERGTTDRRSSRRSLNKKSRDETGGGDETGQGARRGNAKSQERKPTAPVASMRIYGAGWGVWHGMPELKTPKYGQALYQYLTKPLNPAAECVKMYIKREVDISRFNSTRYTLYQEGSNVPVMVALQHAHAMHSTYDIKIVSTGKTTSNMERETSIGVLEAGFLGTEFLLHNNVPNHLGTPKDLACVVYEKTRILNKGPRRMQVAIPAIVLGKTSGVRWPHNSTGGRKHSPMLGALKGLQVKDLLFLINKSPKFNRQRQTFMLDFKGRVTMASVKNFQLVDTLNDSLHQNVLVQHGRVAKHRFSLDVQHPLSILQAFGIALSGLHRKKAVE